MKSAEGRPAIIIDCGIDDFFYDVNVALHEAMQHNNIAHTFITRPGVHTTHTGITPFLSNCSFPRVLRKRGSARIT